MTDLLHFPEDQARLRGGGHGGGGDAEMRLRLLEGDMRSVEEKLKYVALREDVLKLKLWILAGVIGGMLAAMTLGLGIARVWMITE